MDDALIGLLACGSRILTCTLFAFSSTPTMFYTGEWTDNCYDYDDDVRYLRYNKKSKYYILNNVVYVNCVY